MNRLLPLLALVCSAAALAQSAPAAVDTLDLERLELNPSGVGSFVVGSGELLPPSSFRSTAFAHYEHQPLLLQRPGERPGVVVHERLTLHLLRQFSLHQHVEFAVQLPIILFQSGDNLTHLGLPQLAPGGLGSPTLSGRLALLRSRDAAPLDLALQVGTTLPFGNASAFARERGLTLAPRLLASKRLGGMGGPLSQLGFIGLAEAGAVLRTPVTFGEERLHHQLVANAALATTGTPVTGELGLRASWFPKRALSSVELFAGSRYALSEDLQVIGLASYAPQTAPGTPPFRVLVGLSLQERGEEVAPTRAPPPPRVAQAEPPPPKAAEPRQPAAPTTGKVEGQVVDAKTRKPLGGVLVQVVGSDQPPVATAPDAGRFLTHELPSGPVQLTFRKEGYAAARRELTLQPGQTAQVELALEPVTRPALLVLSAAASGKTLGATVQVVGSGYTDKVVLQDGAAAPARLEVPAGQYTVSVTAPGFLSQTRELQVSEGGKLEVAFALAPEPRKRLVEVKDDRIEILQQLHFAPGKATLKADSYPLLDQVLDAIVKHGVRRLRVEGHTDNRGRPEVNMALSEARARAVADYLVRSGIHPSRIEVKGFGGERPIAPNITAFGRELNRRVEFVIVEH